MEEVEVGGAAGGAAGAGAAGVLGERRKYQESTLWKSPF